MTSSYLSESPGSRFQAEDNEISEYRALSRAAVLALVLGMASLLALLSPVFWLLPIFGILFGVMSLRSIAANPRQLAGRGMAWIGLTLACFFGGLAPTQHVLRHRALYNLAKVHGETWLELLRSGKTMEAHQMRLPFGERVTGDASLNEYYAQQQHRLLLDSFAQQSPTGDIVRWGQRCQVRFGANSNIESRGSLDLVSQLYEIVLDEGASPFVLKIELTFARYSFAGTNESRWQVTDVKVISLPGGMPR